MEGPRLANDHSGLLRQKASADRRREAAVLVGSALIHLVIFFVLWSSAAGEAVSAAGGGGPAGPVIYVSLVGPTSTQASTPDAESGALLPLFAKYRTQVSDTPIPLTPPSPSSAFAKLVDRFQTKPAKDAGVTQADQERRHDLLQSPRVASTVEAPTATSSNRASQAATGETKGSASTGEFWGRIEPCWRNIALQPGPPVTLEISINALGSMSRPPKVIRDAQAIPDEPRLRAEARALAALAACLPRGDLRFAQQVYRLDFVSP